jgi:hypothetical protein
VRQSGAAWLAKPGQPSDSIFSIPLVIRTRTAPRLLS